MLPYLTQAVVKSHKMMTYLTARKTTKSSGNTHGHAPITLFPFSSFALTLKIMAGRVRQRLASGGNNTVD